MELKTHKLKSTHPLHPENQTPFLAALLLTMVLLALVYGFVILGASLENQQQSTSNTSLSSYGLECPLPNPLPEATTLIDGNLFTFEVAQNYDERVCGLSNRRKLDDSRGLLFIFEEPDKHGFWMKDMNFAIDILWMNQAGKIVFISDNVSPETYPEVFAPDVPASHVLEINAGQAEKLGLQVGSSLTLPELTGKE